MAKLDILIPHYNDVEGLVLSLNSIQSQDWTGEMRVVVVDDGSADDVRSDLRSLQSKYNIPIEFIFSPVNRGRPHTRNILIDAIDSPYAAWLDAGDEWFPRKLTAQFEAIEQLEATGQTNPVWVTCNYDWAWVGGKRRKVKQRTGGDQVKELLMGDRLRAYLWTLLGTADSFRIVGYFDENLPRLQDLDYFLRFVAHGGVIHNCNFDDSLCVYHKSDVGRDAAEIRACNELIFNKHRILYNRYGRTFVRERLYKMELLAARFAKNNKNLTLKNYYLWRAFKTKPVEFTKMMISNGFKL